MHSTIRKACVTALFVLALLPAVSGPARAQSAVTSAVKSIFSEEGPVDTTWTAQFEAFEHAAARLPLALLLSAMLAFRPRRRGTPKRKAPVIQTQIILAV